MTLRILGRYTGHSICLKVWCQTFGRAGQLGLQQVWGRAKQRRWTCYFVYLFGGRGFEVTGARLWKRSAVQLGLAMGISFLSPATYMYLFFFFLYRNCHRARFQPIIGLYDTSYMSHIKRYAWLAEIWPNGNFCIQKKIAAWPPAGGRRLAVLHMHGCHGFSVMWIPCAHAMTIHVTYTWWQLNKQCVFVCGYESWTMFPARTTKIVTWQRPDRFRYEQ